MLTVRSHVDCQHAGQVLCVRMHVMRMVKHVVHVHFIMLLCRCEIVQFRACSCTKVVCIV
jgi:hypothetical protein